MLTNNFDISDTAMLYFSEPSHHLKDFIKYIEKRIFRPNFMFLGRTVLEKNAMLTCKNFNVEQLS